MTTIEIYSSNYNSFLGLDIIAFSYAEPGAMGERGAVNIAISDGRLLHMNFVKGNININEIQAICPILKECREKKFLFAPQKWNLKRLGFGNYLFINNKIINKFDSLTCNFAQVELYKRWRDIVFNISK
jgi:hypothetical protein